MNGAWRSQSDSFTAKRRQLVEAHCCPQWPRFKTSREKAEDNLLSLSLPACYHPPPPCSAPPYPQTKDALLSILTDLHPADRFNLVGFSNRVKVWQPGRLLPVTPLNIRDAKKFIFTLPTTGGQRSPVCLSVHLSIVCLSSVCLSVRPFSCLSVCPPACRSVHPSVCLCVRLSICRPPICLSIRPSVCPSLSLCLCPSVCLFSSRHQPRPPCCCCLRFRHQHRRRPAGRLGAAAGLPV